MFQIDFGRLLDQFYYDSSSPLIFNSGFFLFIFFLFLIVYTALRSEHRPKTIFVILFSFYFYYKSSGFYCLLLLVSICIDYVISGMIYRSRSKGEKKLLVVITLLINLGMLGYFKYTNFLYESFFWNSDRQFQPLDIFLPVGLSFFTFQSLSYALDVYRGKLRPLENFIDYAFFVSFFPQLVAGPIVRASDFLPQIKTPVIVTREMFGRGVFLFGAGLFKKAVISDYISVNFIDRIFDQPLLYSGIENLFAVYGYALQIYCDFSGYSDMAIGIALLLGFHFPENFRSPYRSTNIAEFWRRWHISLSTWLRDYLYISLGGNRKGRIRTSVNLMITMLIGGLWHGASWRFVLWGALHGAALVIHKEITEKTGGVQKARDHGWSFLSLAGGLVTFHFVCFCWIFFRAADMTIVSDMLNQIVSNFHMSLLPQVIIGYKEVMTLIIIGYCMHFVPERFERKAIDLTTGSPLWIKASFIIVIIILIIQVKSAEVQPFIYFQF